jgi:ATP-dependent protease ClpP protease subunit
MHPLYLHITTHGGDLFASLLLADKIQHSAIPIYTVIEGYAMSGGTIMSVVGKKRYMTPHSYALIHQLNQTMFGRYTYNELKDDHENVTLLMDDLKKLYTKHTKLTEKKLTEIFKHDNYRGYDYCLQHGIVDGIYDEKDM